MKEKISEELEKNLMDSIQTFNQRFFPEKVSAEKMGAEQPSGNNLQARNNVLFKTIINRIIEK